MSESINWLRETAGLVMSTCCVVGTLPQIVKTIKTKRASDLSQLSIIIGIVSGISGFIYVITGEYSFWLILNCVSIFITYSLLFFYWNKYK